MSWVKDLLGFKEWAKRVVPKVKFEENKIPETPNYSDLQFWAAHPNKESKAFFKPKGVADEASDFPADVFYMHPTSYFGQNNWNYDFKNPQATELIEEVLMPLQASVFNSSCRIFAPKYRQATFYSFLWNTEQGRSALEVAYEDLKKAFEYYLEHENNGRPFFIASHSQGTCHAARLLEEVIDKSDAAKKMIAAYIVGFRIPEERFTKGHFQQLKMSQFPHDFNSVIAWDTYLEKGKPSNVLDRAEVWYSDKNKWIKRAGKKPIGVNPISFQQSYEKINAENNLGAVLLVQKNPQKINRDLFGTDELMGLDTIGISTPRQEECGAQLREDGFVYISKPKTSHFYKMMLPGGNMHNYDYDLFYMNFRENIKYRLKAYLENQ